MSDPYANSGSVLSTARRCVAITPNDTQPLTDIPKAVYVGTGGNITLRCPNDGADTVWKNVPSGFYIEAQPQFIRQTGTTAADMIGLYA